MSHHIYHTRGLILGSVPIGESNKFYRIFTEDFGLVGATAQAVREQKSKLRYTLRDFSWVKLDIVRGKDVWRITSAMQERYDVSGEEIAPSFIRACALLSRLVHGEGRNDALFQELRMFAELLEQDVDPVHEVAIDTLIALRILAHLGYIDTVPYQQYLTTGVWSKETLLQFGEIRPSVVSVINDALRASHL